MTLPLSHQEQLDLEKSRSKQISEGIVHDISKGLADLYKSNNLKRQNLAPLLDTLDKGARKLTFLNVDTGAQVTLENVSSGLVEGIERFKSVETRMAKYYTFENGALKLRPGMHEEEGEEGGGAPSMMAFGAIIETFNALAEKGGAQEAREGEDPNSGLGDVLTAHMFQKLGSATFQATQDIAKTAELLKDLREGLSDVTEFSKGLTRGLAGVGLGIEVLGLGLDAAEFMNAKTPLQKEMGTLALVTDSITTTLAAVELVTTVSAVAEGALGPAEALLGPITAILTGGAAIVSNLLVSQAEYDAVVGKLNQIGKSYKDGGYSWDEKQKLWLPGDSVIDTIDLSKGQIVFGSDSTEELSKGSAIYDPGEHYPSMFDLCDGYDGVSRVTPMQQGVLDQKVLALPYQPSRNIWLSDENYNYGSLGNMGEFANGKLKTTLEVDKNGNRIAVAHSSNRIRFDPKGGAGGPTGFKWTAGDTTVNVILGTADRDIVMPTAYPKPDWTPDHRGYYQTTYALQGGGGTYAVVLHPSRSSYVFLRNEKGSTKPSTWVLISDEKHDDEAYFTKDDALILSDVSVTVDDTVKARDTILVQKPDGALYKADFDNSAGKTPHLTLVGVGEGWINKVARDVLPTSPVGWLAWEAEHPGEKYPVEYGKLHTDKLYSALDKLAADNNTKSLQVSWKAGGYPRTANYIPGSHKLLAVVDDGGIVEYHNLDTGFSIGLSGKWFDQPEHKGATLQDMVNYMKTYGDPSGNGDFDVQGMPGSEVISPPPQWVGPDQHVSVSGHYDSKTGQLVTVGKDYLYLTTTSASSRLIGVTDIWMKAHANTLFQDLDQLAKDRQLKALTLNWKTEGTAYGGSYTVGSGFLVAHMPDGVLFKYRDYAQLMALNAGTVAGFTAEYFTANPGNTFERMVERWGGQDNDDGFDVMGMPGMGTGHYDAKTKTLIAVDEHGIMREATLAKTQIVGVTDKYVQAYARNVSALYDHLDSLLKDNKLASLQVCWKEGGGYDRTAIYTPGPHKLVTVIEDGNTVEYTNDLTKEYTTGFSSEYFKRHPDATLSTLVDYIKQWGKQPGSETDFEVDGMSTPDGKHLVGHYSAQTQRLIGVSEDGQTYAGSVNEPLAPMSSAALPVYEVDMKYLTDHYGKDFELRQLVQHAKDLGYANNVLKIGQFELPNDDTGAGYYYPDEKIFVYQTFVFGASPTLYKLGLDGKTQWAGFADQKFSEADMVAKARGHGASDFYVQNTTMADGTVVDGHYDVSTKMLEGFTANGKNYEVRIDTPSVSHAFDAEYFKQHPTISLKELVAEAEQIGQTNGFDVQGMKINGYVDYNGKHDPIPENLSDANVITGHYDAKTRLLSFYWHVNANKFAGFPEGAGYSQMDLDGKVTEIRKMPPVPHAFDAEYFKQHPNVTLNDAVILKDLDAAAAKMYGKAVSVSGMPLPGISGTVSGRYYAFDHTLVYSQPGQNQLVEHALDGNEPDRSAGFSGEYFKKQHYPQGYAPLSDLVASSGYVDPTFYVEGMPVQGGLSLTGKYDEQTGILTGATADGTLYTVDGHDKVTFVPQPAAMPPKAALFAVSQPASTALLTQAMSSFARDGAAGKPANASPMAAATALAVTMATLRPAGRLA